MEPKPTYAQAGVDIAKADAFVERLKKVSKRPDHSKLWKGAGGYASVVPLNDDLAVASTTDGVGTKLLLADELKCFDTIGVDLVAMCANDLICVGATPTAFLDYYATSALDDQHADAIIEGIVKGCDQAGMLLVGGETAELPGLYAPGHFDLAGFAIGTVRKSELITGESIAPGDTIIGVASNGIHSNGLSLARKLISKDTPMRERLLVPTLIYSKPIVEIFRNRRNAIKALAHITGGGWRNVLRLKNSVGYRIDTPLAIPEVFCEIGKTVDAKEMFSTFNMGMGLCIIAEEPDYILDVFAQTEFTASIIGRVTNDAGQVILNEQPEGTLNLSGQLPLILKER